MKSKNIFFTILILCKLNFTFNAFSKEIIIATEATYPPLEFINQNNEIVGFDIDIIKYICHNLKLDYKIVHAPFETLFLGLQTNKFDIAIGGLTINEQRLAQVDFCEPYYIDYMTLVFQKKWPLSLNNSTLKNKNIAVQTGTIFEKYLSEKFKNIVNIKIYSSIGEAFLDLKNGRIDGVLADTSITKYWLKTQKKNKNKFETIDIKDPSYQNIMSIAVKKGNRTLIKKINSALKELKESNEFTKISAKYFEDNTQLDTKYYLMIVMAIKNTFKIAIFLLIIGIILSIIFVIFNFIPGLKYGVNIFLSLIKFLPEYIIIIFGYFILPAFLSKMVGIKQISPYICSSFALGLIFASYATNIIVEAYKTIPKGQFQSAIVLGINKFVIIKKIILPQVLFKSLPSLNNLWIVLLKDTSIVSLIGISEIMGAAKLAANSTSKYFQFYLFAALVYLILTTVFQYFFNKIQVLMKNV